MNKRRLKPVVFAMLKNMPKFFFYKVYTECKNCNSRSLKRYYDNKDEILNQQKINDEKIREKLLKKKKDIYDLKNCFDPMLN